MTPQDQRRLVRWSLLDHARRPNETNLDAHYVLPPEGIWNAHLRSRTADTDPLFVRTKASLDSESLPRTSSSGPRQLISNDPASVDNLSSLQSLPKPPPEPSTTVADCLASDLVPKLRWANIGWSYHWGSKQYDFSKGKGEIDPFLRHLCKRAVGAVPWEKVFEGDDLDGWGDDDWRTWKDTYGLYRNRSHNQDLPGFQNPTPALSIFIRQGWVRSHDTNFEIDARVIAGYAHGSRRPLRGLCHVPACIYFVSCDHPCVIPQPLMCLVRLGNAAVFLIGGLTRDTEPVPLLLRSGDVLIMSGPACRRAYHGWIIPSSLLTVN